AAFFFMAATWVMKTLSQSHMMLTMPLIFVLLALAVWLEIEVLRATRMGHVIVMMLSIELLMTFAVACFFLREHYTTREFIGIGVILFGMLMLNSSQPDPESSARNPHSIPLNTIVPTQIVMPNGAHLKQHQTFSTSTPGRALPSIHSRNAPPAVEI
ncbi:MAG: hypothetical protein ACRCU5_00795, partial [Rhizobiaceae bacterium]